MIESMYVDLKIKERRKADFPDLKGAFEMKCSQLLEHIEYTCLQGSTDVKVSAVVNDSRKIEEGCLFLCIKGASFDGHMFAAEAVKKGAAVLVVEDAVEVPENVTVIKVDNTRYAMALNLQQSLLPERRERRQQPIW